ncbi:MAG: hypothetical protein Q8M54_04100 [Desulfobaccales bacterium]|nr:hypothetical protein [Desulfobaccales bacterium]
MTELQAASTDSEMEEKVRPLVNDILDRFNRAQTSPAEAGMVILGLVHRLLGLLKEAPEARRFFILTMINVINNSLAEDMKGEA